MKIKCEYCNNYIDDSDEKCPSCGSPNRYYNRVGNQVPTTIAELEKWYQDHNLPPYETTRFFIGIDYPEPKAFGIYKDQNTGKFVVYKNKDTGERKIRYEGTDEKYAVNELYMKLKEEIVNQKNLNGSNNGKSINLNNKGCRGALITIIATFIGFMFLSALPFIIIFFLTNSPDRGYYNINNQEYYYVGGSWYVYDNDWISTSEPAYEGNVSDYYDGYSYSGNDSYSDITTSSVYDESWESSSSSSDDWDSDSSWDSSDSWDSGSTDWGSDW